jgi:hypothetical protein
LRYPRTVQVTNMAKFDIDFIWYRTPHVELAKRNTVIRQKGELEPYSPFRMEGMPFAFEKLDGSPEACLNFARNFGLLRTGPAGREEEIANWRDAIMFVRKWIEVLTGDVRVVDPAGRIRTGGIAVPGARTHSDIANVKVFIDCEPGRSRRLTLRPVDLLNAMLLQLATSSGIATCQQCGNWFDIGGEGRRVIARFCSDECRNRHNYEKRRKGK